MHGWGDIQTTFFWKVSHSWRDSDTSFRKVSHSWLFGDIISFFIIICGFCCLCVDFYLVCLFVFGFFLLLLCFLQCSHVLLAVRSIWKLRFFSVVEVFILHLASLQQGLSNLWVGTVPSEQTGRSGGRQKIVWSSQLKSVVVNLIKWQGVFFISCFFFLFFFSPQENP